MLERIGGGQRLGFHALPLVIRVGQPESFYRRLPGLTLSDFLLILLVGALLLPPLTLDRLGVPALPLLQADETLGRGGFALDGGDEKARRITINLGHGDTAQSHFLSFEPAQETIGPPTVIGTGFFSQTVFGAQKRSPSLELFHIRRRGAGLFFEPLHEAHQAQAT